MSLSSAGPERPPGAWTIAAFVLGGVAIGALDGARLGSASLALAVIPLGASVGLVAGVVVAAIERAVAGRPWWLVAATLTAPTLAVTIPACSTLFDGAYAQTLPLARVAPYVLPLVLWLVAAAAVVAGRRLLRAGDLTSRAIAILAITCVLGGIVWVERHRLGSGYRAAHIGATLSLIALVGIAIRIARRATIPAVAAAAIAGLVAGTASASALYGLHGADDRRRVVTIGDQSRDLVRLFRSAFDFDRDGASALLGGGDCDDGDPARHPGALDVPGDGIDQDCDGNDAVAVVVAAPRPPATPSPRPPLDLATWRGTPEVRAVLDRTRPMNVALITIDALRYDMLATDAFGRDDFPRLVRLLDESVSFTRAIAPASGTDVSLSTLLTGRFDPYEPVASTLIEAMRGLGRRTYAAVPGEVTRYVGDILLERGVDHFSHVHTDWGVPDIGDHVSAGATTAEGIKALDDAAGRPAFVWLHYFDVHEHHQVDVPRALLDAVHPGGSPVIHRYRALLRAIDTEIGRFLDELAARHLDDHTIVVLLSDHGEALATDPRLLETHGQVAYGPLVRVPLAIHVPGLAPGTRDDLVAFVDVAPTVLDLVGGGGAMAPLDGHDLLAALLDAPVELRDHDRAVAIHEELQWSVVEWPYQLLVRPADNVVELYDLDRDPGEHDDLSAALPAVVTRMRSRYSEFPEVRVDRTPNGRSYRQQQARPPQPRARR
jgi:hypothetical protein